MSALRMIPATLAAAGLFAVSASAMALSPYQVPGTEFVRNTQPVAVALVANAPDTNHTTASASANPAWVFSADGRNRPIH